MKNKLLLIDSDVESTIQFKKYFQRESYEVASCHDAEKGLVIGSKDKFDLIVLDVVMPKFDGFELLKCLRGVTKAPIVVMTNRDECFDLIYALEIGADDYLSKTINKRELLARIRSIIRRSTCLENITEEKKLDINDISMCISNREVCCNGHKLDLTGFEFEVLHYLMVNAGKIIPKEKIGEYVLGRSVSYYDRSIDMHISNIRKKLAKIVKNKKIKTIRGSGYLFMAG